VHAADEHGVGPGKVLVLRRLHVLVDEAHLPGPRQHGGDHQQALRGHEGAHAIGQRVGVLECAESGRVAWKHAENTPYPVVTRRIHGTTRRCDSSPANQYHGETTIPMMVEWPTGGAGGKFAIVVVDTLNGGRAGEDAMAVGWRMGMPALMLAL